MRPAPSPPTHLFSDGGGAGSWRIGVMPSMPLVRCPSDADLRLCSLHLTQAWWAGMNCCWDLCASVGCLPRLFLWPNVIAWRWLGHALRLRIQRSGWAGSSFHTFFSGGEDIWVFIHTSGNQAVSLHYYTPIHIMLDFSLHRCALFIYFIFMPLI